MAYKTKFIHFKTKASYETERAKTTEGTEERKAFDAYISFVDEGPTMYVFGKEYQCDTNSVSYTSQELTDVEKTQARTNIGAASKDDTSFYTISVFSDSTTLEDYNAAKKAMTTGRPIMLDALNAVLPSTSIQYDADDTQNIYIAFTTLLRDINNGTFAVYGYTLTLAPDGSRSINIDTMSPSDLLPLAAGEASAGEQSDYARADHVHPAQTDITGNAATATMANGVYENNIKLNPEVTSEDFTLMNAALIPEMGQDIFSGYSYDENTIEYTVDGGNTWQTFDEVSFAALGLF